MANLLFYKRFSIIRGCTVKFILILGAILALSTSSHAQSERNSAVNEATKVSTLLNPAKIIIRFEEPPDLEEFDKAMTAYGLQSSDLIPLRIGNIYLAKTRLKRQNDPEFEKYNQLIVRLKNLEFITYVGPSLKNEEGTEFGILDKVFVKLRKTEDIIFLNEYIHKMGLNHPVSSSITSDLYSISFDKNSSSSPLEAAIILNRSGLFEFAEPNYLLNPLVHTQDPLFPQQWALQNNATTAQGNGTLDADMDITEAWEITTGDPSIKVAVMDSGVDTIHWDLAANLLPGFDAIDGQTNGYPTPNYPEDGHGTCVAGIIGAVGNNNEGIAGVAYHTSLIPVRIFHYVDTSLMGVPLGVIPYSTSEAISSGIQWAWQNGADIQNHSWSIPDLFLNAGILPGDPALIDAAIEDAATMGRNGKGSLLFFSSGNEGIPPNWPGRLPLAMAVNATSMCDQAKTPSSCDGQDWSGNSGQNLDFGAPGVRIVTTDMMSSNGYTSGNYEPSFGGTSAAAPNASGVAALLLAFDPDLTLTEAREILSRSCDKVGGYAYDSTAIYGSWSSQLGYGRLNAYQALILAGADPVSISDPGSEFIYSVSPNPTSGEIQIQLACPCPKRTFIMYNVVGQRVLNLEMESGIKRKSFNISDLESGIYFLADGSALSAIAKKIILIK